MERHAYEFRDNAKLMRDLCARVPLAEGAAYLALVKDASTAQRIVRVDRLRTPAEIFDDDEPRQELRAVVERWALPIGRGVPTHTAVLVVVRPGLCVFGPNEAVWFRADRYANHLAGLWPMMLILVTEHGWLDFMTYDAGVEPALVRG